MYLTGFADEAAADIDGQIRATSELGWKHIEARGVDGTNLHDVSDEAFDRVCDKLGAAGIAVICFGSRIANWQKSILDPFDETLAEVRRCVPRMRRLGTKLVRIMSYPALKDRGPEDQMEEERFRRLREIVRIFQDAGMTALHENCMNYGGMGATYTLRLIENVPGLRLVFDTGNPVGSVDFGKPEPRPLQSAWEFYVNVREHVDYFHIKDGTATAPGKVQYTYPGEGRGDVRRIVADALQRGYDGGISIEPHLAVVAHDPSVQSKAEAQYRSYVAYGRRMMAILQELGYPRHGD